MQPGDHVGTKGDTPAVVMTGSGITVTYAELDARSKRLAQLFRAAGLQPGDHMAVLLENHPRYFEVYWAAQRAGLYCTPINWHLTADEAGYIVEDCGARAVITSAAVADVARGPRAPPRCGRHPAGHGRRPGGLGALRDGRRAVPGRRAPRRGRGHVHVLLVGHHRATERHRGRPQRRAVRERWRHAHRPHRGAVRLHVRHHLPVPRAAVPRRPSRMVDGGAADGRDRGVHGALRRRGRARRHRGAPRHPRPVRADALRADAQTARDGARRPRPVQPRRSRCTPLRPARSRSSNR